MSEITQNILEALKAGGMVKAERVRSELEKQRLQQQAQMDMERVKQEQDRQKQEGVKLDQQAEQFKASQAAAAALHNLQVTQLKASISQNPSVAESIGKRVASKFGTPEGQSPLDPNQEIQSNTWELPFTNDIANPQGGNAQITVPTPERYASNQANLERITNAPKVEAEINKILLQKNEDYAKMERQKEIDTQIQSMKDVEANKRNTSTNAARVLAAQISASKSNTPLSSIDSKNYFDRLYSGQLTREGLMKELGGKDGILMHRAFVNSGGQSMTDVQQKALSDIPLITNTVKMVDQFIANQPDAGTGWLASKTSGLLNTTNTKLTGLESQVQAQALLAAQIIAKTSSRSLSDTDRKSFTEGQLPNRFQTKANNLKRRNDMIDAANHMVDAVLHNFSPDQKASIKKDFELDQLLSNGQQQQTNQQQPTVSRIKILSVE